MSDLAFAPCHAFMAPMSSAENANTEPVMICFVSASCVRLLHSAATANANPTHVSPFHLNYIPTKLHISAPRLHRSGGMSSYASFCTCDAVSSGRGV